MDMTAGNFTDMYKQALLEQNLLCSPYALVRETVTMRLTCGTPPVELHIPDRPLELAPSSSWPNLHQIKPRRRNEQGH